MPAVTPSGGALAASVAFSGQSTELSEAAKADLDRVAKNISDHGLRQVELRAHTRSDDPESRKVSLARVLIVRAYLIDKGVKSRIQIGAFSSDGGDRVDILVPNS
jgi:outer membrane protein OmpA-like peptidoglycan-associated protein